MVAGHIETERLLNHEKLGLSREPSPINLHIYQPPRNLSVVHENKVINVFDVSGQTPTFSGFNDWIASESYAPLTEKGVLADSHIDWDLYGVTADWLSVYRPEILRKLQEQVIQNEKLPVGDSYLHIILPFLSVEHKMMLLEIGKRVYHEYWGADPESIWLPESGVDTATIECVAASNFKAVHLREHQVRSHKGSNLYQLNTNSGNLTAIIGHNDLSRAIAFDRPYADNFYDSWFRTAQQIGFTPRLSIDGETLGHHWKGEGGVFDFIAYLNKYLAEGHYNNKLNFSVPESIPTAQVIDETSWSCLDNGLGRWKGSDGCSCALPADYNHARSVRNSKKDLYTKLTVASTRLDQELDTILPGWRVVYMEWFLKNRLSLATGKPISAEMLGDKDIEKLFICSYIRDLGWTSCGWFFGDVNGFERQIPANSLSVIAGIMNWEDVKPHR